MKFLYYNQQIKKILTPATLVILLFAGTAVVLLKLHTDYAPVSQLKWLLAPVTFIVEMQSGMPYFFDEAKGYLSADGVIAIGRTCAGINFIIIAWMMAFSMQWSRKKMMRERFLTLLYTGFTAYCFGVLVNAFRIIAATGALSFSDRVEWLGKHKTHEALGIFIYFSCLLAYYFLLRYRIKTKMPYENIA
ncbi:MAG: sugar transferase [Bacteroidetes bacterium]|nr:MAG: sugar transferase [Bacteroidota bacterium]